MTAELVRRWLDAGELDLPMPGSGHTVKRWSKLAALTEHDVVAGRLAEAHADAAAILVELDGPAPQAGQWWGVWAAESPDGVVVAHDDDGTVVIDGTKAWCSGAGLCTHALVTARRDDSTRGLYAVDLSQPEVIPLTHSWRNAGMCESDTRSVQFSSAPAMLVGAPGQYL